MSLGGGSSGSSQSTTQQTIAPELAPLFAQTGSQLQRLQGFSPFNFQGPFPGFFPQAGGQQPGGQPQVAQIPGLGTPTFVPAGLGTQIPGLAAPAVFTDDDLRRLSALTSTGSLGEGEPDALTPTQRAERDALLAKQQQSQAGGGGGGAGAAGFGGVGTGGLGGVGTGGLGGGGASGLPGTPLDEFLFPRPQQIPGFTPSQFDVLGQQQQRAFGPQITPQEQQAQNLAGGFGQLRFPEASALGLSQNFGGLRFPELLGLGQIGQFAGGEIGQSPATLAAMAAVRGPVLNDLALAGLGNSGAVGTELAGAFAPILAQELQIRAGVIPQLLGLGQQLRGGDVSAANLQSQIGERLRAGDVAGANLLAQQGQVLDLRESRRLGELGATAEQQRTLQQQQQEAIFNDFLRRQGIGSSLTTGLLGGFPAGLGAGAVTTTEGGGASK